MSNSSSPRNKQSGIYLIECIPTGEKYVGQSTDLAHRKRVHLHKLRKGRHYSFRLQAAWDKYGEKAFVFIVAERVPPGELTPREQHYLDLLRPAFNTALRAENPMLGRTHTDEYKRRVSDRFKGVPKSPEHRARIAEALRGRVRTEEHKQNISRSRRENKRPKKLSEEHKRKISEAHLRRRANVA